MDIKENLAILVWGLQCGGAERIAGLLSIYLSTYYNVYLFMRDTEHIVYEYQGQIVDIEPDKGEYCEENVAKAKEKYKIRYSISFLDDMNYINIHTKKNDYVIVSVRCTLSYYAKPHYASMYAMEKYFNYADAVVAVSEGVKYEMINKFGVKPEKIFTIYNFIQQEHIRQEANQVALTGQDSGKKMIVNIGRLDEQKNHMRLLRQFAELRACRDDVRLVLIGSGEREEAIRKEINDLGIAEDVEMLPYCKNPFAYLGKAYMYAMTSHYEGLPNALLEAMCLQIPIVAVDCVGGPRELLEDRSDYENRITGFLPCSRGILVEDSSSDDDGSSHYFRDAMNYLLEDENYCRKVRTNERIFMDSYKNDNILEKWMTVLKNISRNPAVPFEEKADLSETVIYGAGKLGREALKMCRQDHIIVSAFVVSDSTNNPAEIEGIPVVQIDDYEAKTADLQVLLGLSSWFCDDAVNRLLRKGYSNIRFLRFRKENE